MLSGSSANANRSATNAKHAGVLQEAGIAYDSPLNPVQVAAVRAERIAQKQKTAAAMAEQAQAQQQQQRLAASVAAASPGVVAAGGVAAPGSPAALAAAARVTTVASPSTLGASPLAATSVVASSGTPGPVVTGQQTLLLPGQASSTVLGPTVFLFFFS